MKKTLLIFSALLPLASMADPIGLKTAHEIYFGLASATGVSPADPVASAAFASVLGRLPREGKADEAKLPMQFAFVNLAGTFCERFVANESDEVNPERRLVHRQVDFIGGMSGFTSSVARSVIEGNFRIFLGRNPSPKEIEASLAAVQEYRTALGAKANVTEITQILCSATASGPEFLFF